MKIRLEMKNYNVILIERLQKFQLYHQAKLISKYEYITGDEILPFNQHQIIKQDKFTYSPWVKAFEKQTKTIKEQGEKQIDVLESFKSLKPKEVKLKETKPTEYEDFYAD